MSWFCDGNKARVCAGHVVGVGGKLLALSVSAVWGSGVDCCLVLCVFLCCASRWPITVAPKEGGHLFNVTINSPTNGGRNPLCRAVWRVEIDGEKSLACVDHESRIQSSH